MAGPPRSENQENRSPGGTVARPLLPALQAQKHAEAINSGLGIERHGKRKLHRLSGLVKAYGIKNVRLPYSEVSCAEAAAGYFR